MTEEKLTLELEAFDFSVCHPVKERLLGKLLQMHRADNSRQDLKGKRASGRMTDTELDLVAAAGTAGAAGKAPGDEEAWKGRR